jgi:hypothetical protein
MATREKVRAGDVFAIPIDDDQVAVGQVLNVRMGTELLVAVMEGTCRREDAVTVAATRAVLLMGLTMDALLHHGRWLLVGHSEPRRDVPTPTFKVSVAPGRFVEESLDGTKVRDFPASEGERLPYRTVVAPIRIDKAAKALLGMEAWQPHYDALLLDEA